MAGYNGRGSQVQSNATAVNSQIKQQRNAVNATNGGQLNTNAVTAGSVSGMGISRDQTLNMFPRFNGQEIMENSFNTFLSDVEASEHPDFPEKFLPSKFRSNATIINAAQNAQADEAVDFPLIGLGPNLKAQDIDQVRLGNVQSMPPTLPPILERKGGFGITDPEDKALTMGSYFKDRYSVNTSNAPTSSVVKGERDSVENDPYDYNQ